MAAVGAIAVGAIDGATEAPESGTEALGSGTEALGLGTEALGLGTEAPEAGTEALEAGTDGVEATAGAKEAAVEAPEVVNGGSGEWLDSTRLGVQRSTRFLVKGVDSWFGDRPFEEGGAVSGSVSLNTLLREDDGLDVSSRFRLRVKMPNLSRRGYIFLGRENEDDLLRDIPDAFSRSQLLLPESRNEDQSFFVGIGYYLRDNVGFRVGIKGGYRLYSQVRYRDDWWVTEKSNVDFSQTVFLAVRDGLGTTSSVNYHYFFSDRLAFRWRNAGTMSTETDGVSWSTAAGFIRSFPEQRELTLDWVASGETDANVGIREYGLRTTYRRPFLRDWLFVEGILGYFWPRDNDDPIRGESAAAGINLEMIF